MAEEKIIEEEVVEEEFIDDDEHRHRDDLVTDLLDLRESVISARLRVMNRFLDIVSDAQSEWHEIPRNRRTRRRRRKIIANAVNEATDTVDGIVPKKEV